MRQGVTLVILLLLVGCAPAAQPAAVSPPPPVAPSSTAAAAGTTASPTPPVLPTAAPSGTPAPTDLPAFEVCSPLEDISLEELRQPDLLKNPFEAPRPGQDDGHHGADFAYWSRGERTTMLGLPIHSVLNGRVAGLIFNRPPYGNAVIIETSLEALPPGWLEQIPAPAPTVAPAPNLFCPPDSTDYNAQPGRSLYLLYAHMNQAPSLAVGQTVSCGDVIGEVGTTGKSVNAHLHLETRTGPAGAVFTELAHYDNAATQAEMSHYCTWRVNGLFQMFDPLKLLP